MLDYSFFSPAQVIFGWGKRSELPHLVANYGRRVFLVSGSRTLEQLGVIHQLMEGLQHTGLDVLQFQAPSHEPEVTDVDALTSAWNAHQPGTGDVVVGVGGGSTLDLTKAAAAMVTNGVAGQSTVVDFLEGVGRGLKITNHPLPMIAVPTTAGTGTEATKNAVISSYAPPFKKSLRSDAMVPRGVLIDPELTVSLPAQITAATGLDAITQLIESYISKRAAPIPRALCEQGLPLAVQALRRVMRDGADRSAREAMSHAAFLSGLALANSGLGLAHGVAAALGVHCRVSHGLACAVMLPVALRTNRLVRETDLAQLARRTLTNVSAQDAVAAEQFITEIESLCRACHIPARLRDLGVTQSQIPDLVQGSKGNSLSGNPRDFSDHELHDLLESNW